MNQIDQPPKLRLDAVSGGRVVDQQDLHSRLRLEARRNSRPNVQRQTTLSLLPRNLPKPASGSTRSHTDLMATMIGMASSSPQAPHNIAQKSKAMNTTGAFMLAARPRSEAWSSTPISTDAALGTAAADRANCRLPHGR